MTLRNPFIPCALLVLAVLVGCASDSKKSADSGTELDEDGAVAGSSGGESGTRGGNAGTHGASGTGSSGDDAWFCADAPVGADTACSCIIAQGAATQDNCTKPKPTCCFEVLQAGEVTGCQCWPAGSTTCSAKGMPDYPAVGTCPP